MHGRQHTGVSIYEARTETGEKDERSGRGDARATTRATRRRRRRRQQQRETPDDGRRENRRKRETGRANEEGNNKTERDEDSRRMRMLRREEPRRENDHGLSRPLPIISACQNPYLPPSDAGLSHSLSLSLLRAKQTSLLLAFLLALPLPTSRAFPHHPPTVQPLHLVRSWSSPLGTRLQYVRGAANVHRATPGPEYVIPRTVTLILR